MRAALPFAALFGALAFAGAPAEPLRVEWKVHAGCPDANAFWSALISRSDRVRRASTNEEARKISVEITKDSKGSVGRVAIAGFEPRTIAAASCNEVVDAIAIVTALVLDPAAVSAPASASEVPPPVGSSATPPPPSASSSAPPLPEPPPIAPPARPPPPAVPWKWAFGVGLGAFANAGVGAVVTTPLAFEITRDFTLRLNLARAKSGIVRSTGGPGARFVWWTARLDVCPARGRSVVALIPCAGIEGGSVAGDAIDTDRPRGAQRLWLTANVLSRLSVALGRASYLELEGGTALVLTRPEFYVEPDYFLYRPAPFVFHARAGLMVHFP